ncbi:MULTISPECIES: short-chain fatty acid transporter [Pseudonocardia]|uniref:Short-chain fatty acids transporter n=2 Tax=Pseudonocardia TaxID=1847 RepID=A0A1Y2MMB8_PSEAH|nr:MULTISPECIES: TIGR00366 family protein [Pseudonocardia]OSY35598.1 Short-chain fatty acids transporter [Pseudonocardia autotrophica]TDN76889.1 short-chain fatty acids transporter [Pseudonocardia autotrophica]BBG00892.1 short-chain fatty acid transporter [Pseudonocardia autotrophica]GEC27549.1 short-chain fatty acid transporter [Pseudonocardia saturnea]
MLQKLGRASSGLVTRLMPDAFIFAIVLSLSVYLAGVLFTSTGPIEMIDYWYEGFWSLLDFMMQMSLVLLTGYVLAQSPILKRVLERIAARPQNARQAIFLIALSSLIAGFLNWGLGLVVGAVMAIAVVRSAASRGIRVHYALAVAAGYMGLSIHSAGFSSTAALLVNTEGHFLQDVIGIVPLSQTILSPYNLILVAIYLAVVPFVLRGMTPPPERSVGIESDLDGGTGTYGGGGGGGGGTAITTAELKRTRSEPGYLVRRLEHSPWVIVPIVAAGTMYVGYLLITSNFSLDINMVNFIFLMIGLVLYRTPMAYVRAITGALSSIGGIVVQFPFYAGMLGMLAGSGLVDMIARGMLQVSTPSTFPLLAFMSAAVVNFLIPSAGGQWAVQGPILIEAGRSLGVSSGVVVMAHQYGDQVTNMLQPFWALPLLGLTGLKARDILGYTAVIMFVGIVIFGLGITFLPPLFGM